MSDDLRRLELMISRIMRVGVFLSAIALASGLVMMAIGNANATRLLNAGLMLLMTIPAARILASFGDAVARKDRLLATATAIVSLVLLWQFLHK